MIAGVVNMRDFGGGACDAGGVVRRGRLYRSGQLANLPPAVVDELTALDFSIVADLRYPSERREEPSPWRGEIARRVLIRDVERDGEAPHLTLLRTPGADVDAVEAFYRRFYAELPFDPPYERLFGRALNAVADAAGPILIHCSAGKDRTGVLVALLLTALGVTRPVVVADYLLSLNDPWLRAAAPSIADTVETRYGVRPTAGVVKALLDVKADYLDLAFREIDARCGSLEAYLDRIGVDAETRTRLRDRYVRRSEGSNG